MAEVTEIVFMDDGPVLFETAPFGTTGHPYVMAFGQDEVIADPTGSVIVTEQISIS